MPQFKVRVTKDHLVFSAGHFITYAGNVCERLHGHNWRVAVELHGPLDENQYVYDFIALRDAAAGIVAGLDHRMLLPTQHPRIRVRVDETEVEARFEERRWVFPRGDCVLLPIANTTTELIACWIGEQLIALLGLRPTGSAGAAGSEGVRSLAVEVEENFGQWGVAEFVLGSSATAG